MEKGKFWNAVADKSELSTELAPMQPIVELFGDNRVLIENHRGVYKYGCDEISVFMKYGRISVRGEKLSLALMTRQRIVICGCICSIELCKGD